MVWLRENPPTRGDRQLETSLRRAGDSVVLMGSPDVDLAKWAISRHHRRKPRTNQALQQQIVIYKKNLEPLEKLGPVSHCVEPHHVGDLQQKLLPGLEL